jgi:hyperosmotically inducible protein
VQHGQRPRCVVPEPLLREIRVVHVEVGRGCLGSGRTTLAAVPVFPKGEPLMKTRIFPTIAFASILSLGAAALPVAHAQDSDDMATKSEQPVDDTWITTKVKSELATTDGVKSLDIEVKTINSVVTLIGVQPNELAVKKAVAAAKSIKGVVRVDASGLKVR